MAATLSLLLSNSIARDKKSSKLKLIAYRKSPNSVSATIQGSSGTYQCEISSDDNNITLASQVQVACTCDDFKFRWAYGNFIHKCLLNQMSYYLAPSIKTNPNNIPGLCYHLQFLTKEHL